MSDKKITLDSIVKGKQERPVRQVIYGRDGIGKTHYMCGAEDIIVMHLKMDRMNLMSRRFNYSRRILVLMMQ